VIADRTDAQLFPFAHRTCLHGGQVCQPGAMFALSWSIADQASDSGDPLSASTPFNPNDVSDIPVLEAFGQELEELEEKILSGWARETLPHIHAVKRELNLAAADVVAAARGSQRPRTGGSRAVELNLILAHLCI